MKLFAKIFALAIGMFLLTSFGDQPPTGNPRLGLPAELRQIMDENREITFPPPHPDLEDTVNSFIKLNLDRDEHIRIFEALRQVRTQQDHYTLRRVFGRPNFGAFLTHEQLGEEIRFLFDLLRHGYDGYLYFGGDEVFLPIRDAMLESLAGMPDPLRATSYLDDLLLPAFQGVVADNHFQIQHVRFGPPAHVPYMNEGYVLRRGGSGFVVEIDGATHGLVEVKGLPLPSASGILPTLTPDGELAWAFGFVKVESQQGAMEITVLLEDTVTGENRSRPVTLRRVDSPRFPTHPVIVKHEVEGITVLENRSLRNLSNEENAAFLQSGYGLRDRPILVMDLRGHTGGGTGLPSMWIANYTGQTMGLGQNSLFAASILMRSRVKLELIHFFTPLYRSILMDRYSNWNFDVGICPRFAAPEHLPLLAPTPGSFERDSALRFETIARVNAGKDLRDPMLGYLSLSTSVRTIRPHVPIPNRNLVIVLTDKNIASTGDLFVGHLRQLENVLVVGTNTSGTFFTGAVGSTMLPHSGFAVRVGTRLNLRHDLSQFEGVGFMPDLWVPPGESLERVLRFIERYGLAR